MFFGGVACAAHSASPFSVIVQGVPMPVLLRHLRAPTAFHLSGKDDL
jgi:hypothetical protein